MRFWLSRKGSTEGPFEESELATRIGSGEIGGNDLVCAEGGQQWVAIASHPTLSTAIGGTRPSRPIAPTMAMSSELTSAGGAASSSGAQASPVPVAPGSSPVVLTPPPSTDLTPTTIGSPEFAALGNPALAPQTTSATSPSISATPVITPKRSPALLVGAGCALAAVLSACCIVTGVGTYLYMGSGGGMAAVIDEHIGDSFVAAIYCIEPSRAFSCTYCTDDFTHSDSATVRATLAPVGDQPDVVFTAVRFHADVTTAGQRHNVSGTLVVFPDGRVRHSDLGHYALESFIYEGGTDTTWVAISEEETAIYEGVLDTLEKLSGSCDLVMLSPGDVSDLPTSLVSEVLEHASESERNEVCARVLPLFAGRFGWEHVRMEQAVVLVRGNGRVGALSAEFVPAQHAFGRITGQMADVRH